MSRVDLFGPVHKGIRAALAQAAQTVAHADFACVEDAHACTAVVGRLLGFLREHAEHEDGAILPEIAALDARLAGELEADHRRFEALERELERTTERLERASRPERLVLGEQLHARLWRLMGEHLVHMAREEGEGNRALWAHRSDAQLRAIEGRIILSIPVPRLAEYVELMLVGASLTERVRLLGELRDSLPADVFEAVTEPARWSLGYEAWARAAHAAGICLESRPVAVPVAEGARA